MKRVIKTIKNFIGRKRNESGLIPKNGKVIVIPTGKKLKIGEREVYGKDDKLKKEAIVLTEGTIIEHPDFDLYADNPHLKKGDTVYYEYDIHSVYNINKLYKGAFLVSDYAIKLTIK